MFKLFQLTTLLRIYSLAIALLFLTNSLSAQQKISPLAVYRGVQEAKATTTLQAYTSLLDSVAVSTVGPLDARTIIAASAKVKQIDDDRFEKIAKGQYAIGDNKWAVQYGLTFQDVPLASPSGKMLLMKTDGQPLEYRDRQIPKTLPSIMQETVTPKEAVLRAKAEAIRQWTQLFPNTPAPEKWTTSEPEKEIWVDDEDNGHLAWLLLVRAEDVRIPISLQCWVEATGIAKTLHVKDLIYSSHNGTLVGNVLLKGPLDASETTPLPGALLTRLNVGDSTTTDGLGQFLFQGNVLARDLIVAAPFGPRCVIMNDAGAEIRAQAQPLGGPATTIKFEGKTEYDLAQLTAFYWVNQASAFTQPKIGDKLNYVPTRVNLNDTGNAFWDGYALNFFRAGDGFPNTAYSDVIIHEFGHAVDGRLGGIHSRGYSEGFGDALALLITKQPLVGRDFYGLGKPMRDARETVKWTDADVNKEAGEPHRVGQVYSGFVWELIQAFNKKGDVDAFHTVTKLVLDSAEMDPKDIPDAVRLTFVADDNDGDLQNGTPNADVIKEAAKSRLIPLPVDLFRRP